MLIIHEKDEKMHLETIKMHHFCTKGSVMEKTIKSERLQQPILIFLLASFSTKGRKVLSFPTINDNIKFLVA